LMFGLYAARRSTAPISSATPVRREIHTWSESRVPHWRSEYPQRRARRGSAASPSGSHTVQSGLRQRRPGLVPRPCHLGQSGASREPGGDARRAPRRPRPASRAGHDRCDVVLGGEVGRVGTSARGSGRRSGSHRGLDACVAPTRRGPSLASSEVAARDLTRGSVRTTVRAFGAHKHSCRRARPRAGGTITRGMPRASAMRTRATDGASERHEREIARVDPRSR
jgi:hypothetical protein